MRFTLQQLIQAYGEGRTDGAEDARSEVAEAWEQGWHAHWLEEERQQKDPTHPITKTNPHGEARSWEQE